MSERTVARRRATWRLFPAVLLATGLAAQVWVAVRAAARQVERVEFQRAVFGPQQPPADPANVLAAAARNLTAVAARLPPRARVLVVSPVLPRIQYEFYFLPRPFAMLVDFPPDILDLLARDRPELVWQARHRRQLLADRGQLWSPDRFAQVLPQADHVVTFRFDLPEPERWGLEPAARIGQAVLYGVRRR